VPGLEGGLRAWAPAKVPGCEGGSLPALFWLRRGLAGPAGLRRGDFFFFVVVVVSVGCRVRKEEDLLELGTGVRAGWLVRVDGLLQVVTLTLTLLAGAYPSKGCLGREP
jgi:hypothetical protein